MKEKILIDLNGIKLLKESPSLVSFGAKLKQVMYYMFAPEGTSFSNFINSILKGL